MRLFWKLSVLFACAAVVVTVISWSVHKRKTVEQQLLEAANLRRQAEQGDATAQSELGSRYYLGQGVPRNFTEALGWYQKAADQGNQEAELCLGQMYYTGQGVSQDYNQAYGLVRKAADQGNAKAQYTTGYMNYYGQGTVQSFTEALRWYRKAADQGEMKAQYSLGLMYYYGQGVPQDHAEAARWYHEAAARGLARAQYDLGFLYYYGQGVQQDRAEASRWFRKAADQGEERAQNALGLKTGLNTFSRIYLSLVLLGSILLWVDSRRGTRQRRRRVTALTGFLGVSWVGLSLLGLYHFGVYQGGIALNGFYFAKSFLGGVFAVMAISLLSLPRLKIVLQISIVLFVGFNTYAIVHYDLRRFAPAIKTFCSVNGWSVGMFIASVILLWTTYRKSRAES